MIRGNLAWVFWLRVVLNRGIPDWNLLIQVFLIRARLDQWFSSAGGVLNRSLFAPLLPAALAAGSACWFGTFLGAAGSLGAAALSAVLLGLVAFGGRRWLDPWELGSKSRLLVHLLWLSVVASWHVSTVPRAGTVALALLPAFLLLPATLAHCWRREAARHRGLLALSFVVAGVALWALVEAAVSGFVRPALPLGHHRLLACWLVTLLPLAALPLLRPGGRHRLLATLALVLGSSAVLASGSLTGILALAVEAGVGLWLLGRRSPKVLRFGLGALAATALLILALHPRTAALASFEDSSLRARAVYWFAGWAGFAESPIFGQGPGSIPWTLGRWLQPIPGVSPPQELVGDLHSLPLGLFYELGFVGPLVAAVAIGLFWRRRWQLTGERALTLAAALGTAGFLLVSLAGAPLSVPSLPLALAIVFGGALSADRRPAAESGPAETKDVSWLPWIYVILALSSLFDPLWAQRKAEVKPVTDARLEQAVSIDPAFPLYRFRLAAVTGDATAALEAARGAPGIAAPWLLAGRLAVDRGETGAEALETACRLDALAGAAPFLRLLGEPEAPRAPSWAARALLAEPRLLASTFWQTREELRREAVALITGLDGVEEGWRVRLLEVTAVVEALELKLREEVVPEGSVASSPVSQLAVVADRPGFGAFSLHHFRRLPRALDLVVFDLGSAAATAVDLPPASHLGTTEATLFLSGGCHLGGNSEASAP